MAAPRTTDELMVAVAGEMGAWVGNNPLADPSANRSNNLVRLMTIAMRGQSELEFFHEGLLNRDNIANLEGELLTLAAARIGVFRKMGARSKATLMVTGEACAVLPKGAVLVDSFGNEWDVVSDVALEANGCSCPFAEGIVCASEPGCWKLRPRELRYDNSESPLIFSATNGMMLEFGGEFESDESLRRRILRNGPLSGVCGTAANLISCLHAVDGVNLVRYDSVVSCIGEGPMVVVHGGDDDAICETIALKVPLGCHLIGETECDPCRGPVRFQRPCPRLLKVRVHVDGDCQTVLPEDLIALLMSLAPSVAYQETVTAYQLAKLHPEILFVEFCVQYPQFVVCPEEEGLVLIDPFTGEEFIYDSLNPFGICGAQVQCPLPSDCIGTDLCSGYQKLIKFNLWEFPVLDPRFIEVVVDGSPYLSIDCETC